MSAHRFRRLECVTGVSPVRPNSTIRRAQDARVSTEMHFMKQNPIEDGRLSDHGRGIGTVTKEMVMKRAREIAVINGRTTTNVLDSDVDEAQRELEGEDEMNPQPTAAENLTEDQRWEPVAGSQGRKAPTYPASDEQTVAEKLYDEGVADAEHDQEIQATREDLRRSKSS